MRRILDGKIYDTETSEKFLSYPDHDIYQAPDKSFFRVERDKDGKHYFTLMGMEAIIGFYESRNLEISDEILPMIQDLIKKRDTDMPF